MASVICILNVLRKTPLRVDPFNAALQVDEARISRRHTSQWRAARHNLSDVLQIALRPVRIRMAQQREDEGVLPW